MKRLSKRIRNSEYKALIFTCNNSPISAWIFMQQTGAEQCKMTLIMIQNTYLSVT